MSVATMTSKGQVTVPKDVRDELGLEAGSRLMFVKVGHGHYRLLAKTGSIRDLAGILRRPGQHALSIDEMDAGIASAAAEAGIPDDSDSDVS